MEMCEEIRVIFKALRLSSSGELLLDERGILMEKLTLSIIDI
jgi:hypothetical protein